MTNEIVKKLKDHYGNDTDAILRKLGDLLNIPYDEALKMLNGFKKI